MEATLDDVKRIAEEHPTLTAYDYFPTKEVPRFYKAAPFEERRKDLFTEKFLEQVKVCQFFIQEQAVQTKGFNLERVPFNFKHDVEAWERIRGNRTYITEGAFIIAALLEGVKGEHRNIYPPDADSQYIQFCLKLKVLDHEKLRNPN